MDSLERKAVDVVRRLHDAGHTAYLAGGCVRDRLLGHAPGDYDIATSARPGQVIALFPRTVEVGVQFGVVRVMVDTDQFEVATFRSDAAYIDGRRPGNVRFTDPREDALRRDFTINGMFYDPLDDRLIDHVGGQADLRSGVVRAIGEPSERFAEDRLRLLRAVRFAARFGFRIEDATFEAIRRQATDLGGVSAERLRDELVRVLLDPSRARGLDLLDESGLLAVILPEVAATKGCEQPPQFHPEGDVYTHTRIMLELLPDSVSIPLAFGALFHDIGKPPTFAVDDDGRIRFNGHDRVGAAMTERIMRRLRFANREIEDTVEIVRQHMTFKDVREMRPAKLKRFMARPTFPDELELHRVDCESSHNMLDNHTFLLAKREEFAREPLIPAPLVTGRDLIAMGLRPGPLFGVILEEVQTRQLEGTLTTREQALGFVRDGLRDGLFDSRPDDEPKKSTPA